MGTTQPLSSLLAGQGSSTVPALRLLQGMALSVSVVTTGGWASEAQGFSPSGFYGNLKSLGLPEVSFFSHCLVLSGPVPSCPVPAPPLPPVCPSWSLRPCIGRNTELCAQGLPDVFRDPHQGSRRAGCSRYVTVPSQVVVAVFQQEVRGSFQEDLAPGFPPCASTPRTFLLYPQAAGIYALS